MRLNSSFPPPVAETASPRAKITLREESASTPVEIKSWFAFTSPAVSKGVREASCLICSKAELAASWLPSMVVSAT